MTRVLIVINSFGMGGAEKSTASLIPFLVNKGFEVSIIVFHQYPHGYYDAVAANPVALTVIGEKSFFKKVLAVRKVIRSFKPDIIHSILFESNLIGRAATVGFKIPYVESLINKSYADNRVFSSFGMKMKHLMIKQLDRSTFGLVDRFHAVSNSVKSHYVEEFGVSAESIVVVHRGREAPSKPISDISNSQLRTTLGIQKTEVVIICIGRQEYQKAFIDTLKAINELTTTHSGFVCLIAGRKGQASEELEQYIEAHALQGVLKMLDYRDDIPELLSIADIYISASLFEGLPGSTLEAMAYGLPLVLRNIPENQEVAVEGKNALFFNKQDEFVKALKILMDQPSLRNAMGSGSKEMFDSQFTMALKAEEMVQFFKDSISKRL